MRIFNLQSTSGFSYPEINRRSRYDAYITLTEKWKFSHEGALKVLSMKTSEFNDLMNLFHPSHLLLASA